MPRYTPCFNTSTIRPAPLLTKIEAAARAGFRAIELWNDDVTAFVQQGGDLQQVKDALAEHNLDLPNIIAVYTWVGVSGPGREERRTEAIRRMTQARDLGARFIVASPPPGQADLAQAGEDYRELLQIGRDLGIRPAMEFLGFVGHVNNIRTCWEIVERAGDPDGTIVIDWFHMVRGDGRDTIFDDLRGLKAEQIAIVHLDDVPYSKPFGEMTDGDRVYPGDGDIPVDELFQVLGETGYEGPVSLELFNPEYWQLDPFEVARTGYEKSRRWYEL